jgi:hypothetical protein
VSIKKIFFYGVIVFVNYVLLELVAYGFFRLNFGDYDRQAMQIDRIRSIAQIQQGPVFSGEDENTLPQDIKRKEVLHPYFGYVTDAKIRTDGCIGDSLPECYTRIKAGTDKPFAKRSDDRLIVGVIGGSVAVGTTNGVLPKNLYQTLLARLPEYKGRDIILYDIAAGGLRQPQQLMMLNYYYALGAEFDLLINLDGFNDVVMPPSIFKNSGTHPSYPRSWANRVANTVSKDLVDLLAERKNLQDAHSSKAALMSNPWFRNSPFSNLLWQLAKTNYNNRISVINQAVETVGQQGSEHRDFNYQAMGPDYDFTTWDDLYQYAVDMWATSSHLMYASAKANNAKYVHFLQPNQYIEGSKLVMSEHEREVALIAEHKGGYGNLYRKIYPRIQNKISWLEQRGIEFHNLSYLYKDVEAQVFRDNCCHFNSLGYNMLVEKIVETIHQSNLAAAANNVSAAANNESAAAKNESH